MDYIYNAIRERDIDMLITTAFGIDKDFSEWFVSKVTSHTNVEIVRVSVSESTVAGEEAGENDVTVFYKSGGDEYCLLIEDKINAQLQPKQAERYYKRAAEVYKDYKKCTVCLFCPENYKTMYEENNKSVDDKHKFTFFITYEECIEYYRNNSIDFANVAISQLNLAINKNNRNGLINENVQDFSKKYIELAESDAFNLKSSTDAESANGYWIQFPVKLGKNIMHKVNKNQIDWNIGNKKDVSLSNLERFVNLINSEFGFKVRLEKTGKSYSIRYDDTPKLNHELPFEDQIDKVKECLQIIKKMTEIADMFYIATEIGQNSK